MMNIKKAKNKTICVLKAMALPVILYLILLILIPSRVGNLKSISIMFMLTVVPTIAAYGVSFGFISGIMDFSIGSRMMLSGMFGAIGAHMFGIVGLVVFTVVSSIILSAIIGGLFWLLKIPSLIVSLGMLMLFEVAGVYLAQYTGNYLPELSTGYYLKMDQSLTFIGNAPVNYIILVLVAVLFYFVYYRTKFSNQARVVGSDELIAKNIGINSMKVKFSTYIAGGVFLGIASVVSTCYSGAAGSLSNMSSMTAVFKPIMSVVVGMTLKKYVSFPLGIFIGALSINIIFAGIIALGWSDNLQKVLLGFFLIVIVGFPKLKNDIEMYIKRCKKRKLFAEQVNVVEEN